MPKPGEIWMVQRDISELVPSFLLNLNQFSEPARHFIQGNGPSRYVMIVGDVRLLSEYSMVAKLNAPMPEGELQPCSQDDFSCALMNQYWVSAMVFGHEQNGIHLDDQYGGETTEPLSNVDVWLPACVSGLSHNVIAETWHIVPMLVNQLLGPVGHRCSSTLYSYLMDIGDAACDQDCTPVDNRLSLNHLQCFHQAEQQWSEVLRFPITACHMQLETLNQMTSIMERAIWLERLSLRDG